MKTLTIQLSPQDSAFLEAEAQRRNMPPEILAQILIHNSITQAPHTQSSTSLHRLRQTESFPSADPVQLIHGSRQQLEQRSSIP
jgi:hypothetical protein